LSSILRRSRIAGNLATLTPFQIVSFTKTLYHGSPKPVKKFDVEKGGGRFGNGIYLTPDLKTAQFYAAGGRQGSAGQKLKDSGGYVYEFKVSGQALKVNDEIETMSAVVDQIDEAADAAHEIGDRQSSRVTKYLGQYASDYHNCPIVWFADKSKSVMNPFEQVLVTNDSAIKSVKPHKGKVTAAKGDWEKLGYTIEHKGEAKYLKEFTVVALDKSGKEVGHVEFTHMGDYLNPDEALVGPKRIGLATAMYDYAESLTGVPVKPSDNQHGESPEFWRDRLS